MKGSEQYRTIVLGCDHAAFEMKGQIGVALQGMGLQVEDLSPVFSNPMVSTDAARRVCAMVISQPGTLGILACGTGAGMCVAANRVRGIRAVVLYDDFTAEYARRHNDANILIFGSRTMAMQDVLGRISIFLDSEFDSGKYAVRNTAIDNPEACE